MLLSNSSVVSLSQPPLPSFCSQEMVDHITSQLFEKHKVLSAALATIATLEQLVLCDCSAASPGFDATVYIFVRVRS